MYASINMIADNCNMSALQTSWISLALRDLESGINQLEADKLEAYKHIIKNSTSFEFDEYGENKAEYCLDCSQDPMDHNSGCIVNKANKYIKEVEK